MTNLTCLRVSALLTIGCFFSAWIRFVLDQDIVPVELLLGIPAFVCTCIFARRLPPSVRLDDDDDDDQSCSHLWESSILDDPLVNPASGSAMSAGGMTDVEGNPYGSDLKKSYDHERY